MIEHDDDIRTIITPEAVALPVRLADPSLRIAALVVDLGLVLAIVMVSDFVVQILLSLPARQPVLATVGIFISFFMRTGYFIAFEGWWRGQTPGKRLVGICVVDRKGRNLSAAAILARNAMRELELFLPISLWVVVYSGVLSPKEAHGVNASIFGLAWALLMTLLPLFNRDRCRPGDFLAGTLVIENPKPKLFPDLVASEGHFGEPKLIFTDAQLDLYGKQELQLLGNLLRGDTPATEELLEEIAQRIQSKIRWRGKPHLPLQFLQAFYTSQRAYLERRMLMGEARESKRRI